MKATRRQQQKSRKKLNERVAVSSLGTLGGLYKPLNQLEVGRVYDAALEVLEKTGMANATNSVRELALERGCSIDTDNRLLMPRKLVTDVINSAARGFTLYGQSPEHDVQLADNHVHFATGGAAVTMLDWSTQSYRPSTLQDLYQLALVCERLPNIQWFTRPVVATDMNTDYELDLNTVYAMVKGTTKHLGTSIVNANHVNDIVALIDTMLGRTGAFLERPFLSVHATTIVSPLTFAEESSEVATEVARLGIPILSQTGPMAGATAPTALAGTLVQTVAESLAGLVAINLVQPGHPVIVSGWPFVVDLRTGSFTGGNGEQALLSSAFTQVMKFLELPCGVPAGMSDSKLPDNQAGYEKALTVSLSAMSGADFVYESAGMLAGLLGCSLEAMVIDDEMLSSIRRTMQGIDVNEASLSIDVINQAVRAEGHFLGNKQTLSMMESEYVYPVLADRLSPTAWTEQGASDMWTRAEHHVQTILSQAHPNHIPHDHDVLARQRFPIRLEL